MDIAADTNGMDPNSYKPNTIISQADGGRFSPPRKTIPVTNRFHREILAFLMTSTSHSATPPAIGLINAWLDFAQNLDTWPNRRTLCCGWPTEISHCRG